MKLVRCHHCIERSELAKEDKCLLLRRTPANWWLIKSWAIDKDDPVVSKMCVKVLKCHIKRKIRS
jgi:hypothetical protein